MRKQRLEAKVFLTIVLAAIITLLSASFLHGGTKQLLLAAGVLAAAATVTVIILLLVAYQTQQKLKKLIKKTDQQWAAKALILEGDIMFTEGTKTRLAPPGPKGNLTLKDQTLTWTPEKTTAQRGYQTVSWNANKQNTTKIYAARDISGIKVETWETETPTNTAQLQIYAQTSPLEQQLK